MKFIYTCANQIPSRASNCMQIMRMCSALQRVGNKVTLVHPLVLGPAPEGFRGDLWAFYGLSSSFDIVTLPTLLTPRLSRLEWFSRGTRAGFLSAYLLWLSRPANHPFIAYGRSLMGASIALHLRRVLRGASACRGVMIELHDVPLSTAAWRVVSQLGGIVTTTAALKQRVVDECPGLSGQVWVEPAGADMERINPTLLDRESARRRLGLENVRGPILVYTGRVMAGKGVDVLLEATSLLADLDARLLIVGKVYEPDYLRRTRTSPQVSFTGFVPPGKIPDYLASADILVMPSTPALSYAPYTSPLKLAEYLASGRPVVAADLPVLREVVIPNRNALLYPPYDASALAAALRRVWADPGLQSALAAQASRTAERLSWDNRARRVTEYARAITGLD